MSNKNRIIQVVKSSAHVFANSCTDLASISELVGNSHIVMIGEATHGTREFYKERAKITQHLIEEKGFNVVAIEGDWPDAYKVNNYVKGRETNMDATEALKGFSRFPTWMWDNAEVYDFIVWLRAFNAKLEASREAVSFYGLDIYSLYRSIDETVKYLEKIDPQAAERARSRFDCFSRFGEDCQYYGMVTSLGFAKGCEDEVVQQLVDMVKNDTLYKKDGEDAEEAFFSAEQNTRLIQAAERYYRTMFDPKESSWNVRDTHMADTIERIRTNLLEKKN